MKIDRKKSVVLVSYPNQGHLTPMLQLGSILHSQGFTVIVAHTEYNAPNYSNHPEFIFHSMDDGLKGIDFSLPSLNNIFDLNENCKVPLRNYLVRMMEEEGDQLACIIYDKAMFIVDDVATKLGIPSIVLRVSSAAFLLSMITILQQPEKYFPFVGMRTITHPLVRMMEEEGDQLACMVYDKNMFMGDDVATQLRIPSMVLHVSGAAYVHTMITILQQPEKYLRFEESQLLDPLPELHPLRFKDLPFPVINNTVPEPLLEYYRAKCDIGSSVASIWNTTQDLESSLLLRLQEHYKVPLFPIGPLHKMAPMASSTSILEEDSNCIEWLDRQAPNSVLYVSLGSIVRIDDKELIETALGLANSDQLFLWVIRPGSVSGFQWAEALPDGFEEMVGERGRIVKWAPQKQVLAHPAVAGFFTHCGWNSMLESICEAVPMICRPFLGDHPVNTRYVSQIYKVGFELEVIERTVIEKTVRKLMLSEEGKEVKKRVVEMKQNIVAGMKIDGTSHKNVNDLVDFISALPSRLPPPTPVVGAII